MRDGLIAAALFAGSTAIALLAIHGAANLMGLVR